MKKISQNNEIGTKGEDIAASYLSAKGYKILHRNWRFGHKELDLVAKQNDIIVVVEVKTRSTQYWEEPKESVKRKKQKLIILAADEYMRRYNLNNEVRFDIVSIILKPGTKPQIEHIEDAFYPTL
ncbi:MAG: putative endonuclease [Tenuifilum sp.]|nr:putative endonuclease [Tenuifilum sp.]